MWHAIGSGHSRINTHVHITHCVYKTHTHAHIRVDLDIFLCAYKSTHVSIRITKTKQKLVYGKKIAKLPLADFFVVVFFYFVL